MPISSVLSYERTENFMFYVIVVLMVLIIVQAGCRTGPVPGPTIAAPCMVALALHACIATYEHIMVGIKTLRGDGRAAGHLHRKYHSLQSC